MLSQVLFFQHLLDQQKEILQRDDEGLQGQMHQQDLSERDKRHFLCALVVPQPPRKAFAPALKLGAVGHVGGHFGQLGALAPDDAANQRREGRQVPGERSGGLAGIPLDKGGSDGTIPAEVVAHCMLLLEGSHFPESIR